VEGEKRVDLVNFVPGERGKTPPVKLSKYQEEFGTVSTGVIYSPSQRETEDS